MDFLLHMGIYFDMLVLQFYPHLKVYICMSFFANLYVFLCVCFYISPRQQEARSIASKESGL